MPRPFPLLLCALLGIAAGFAPMHARAQNPPASNEGPDSDGDGVPDSRDMCPGTPQGIKVDEHGCPCEVTVHVEFASGSAELTEDAKTRLDRIVGDLSRLPWVTGVIEGHSDAIGGDKANLALSRRRAAAVRAYLISQGIAGDRMALAARGSAHPIADDHTARGRARNRRAVLHRTDCR